MTTPANPALEAAEAVEKLRSNFDAHCWRARHRQKNALGTPTNAPPAPTNENIATIISRYMAKAQAEAVEAGYREGCASGLGFAEDDQATDHWWLHSAAYAALGAEGGGG